MSENKSAPVAQPVAWEGVDLDAMCEAFSRCIEAQHAKSHPFHNPVNADAMTALRILRWMVPAMKAYNTPPDAPASVLTRDHVMSALALCPTDLPHPKRCEWIANKLNEATGQEGGK